MNELGGSEQRKSLTLMGSSLGFVVVQLDVTVVNVALQGIGSSVGGGIAALQWVVSAYTIAFASLILSAGAAGDRFGAKRVFMAGFAIFVLASLGCALAPGLPMLIASRVLQGLGAAILVPSSLALLNHTFRGEHERTRAVAIWAAGASVALAAGPVVGGVLIAAIGWRSIFFINLPLGLLGIWLTWRYVDETTRTQSHSFDYLGQALAILALADLAGATIEGGKLGWGHPGVLGGFATFALAAGAFVFIESRAQRPMMPLSLFRNQTFSAATLVGLLINIAYYGLIFIFSLFFQQTLGYSALKAGLAFLPMTAIVLAANLSASRLVKRFGSRLPILLGQGLFLLGSVTLLGIGLKTPYRAMTLQLLAIGAGIGLIVPPMTSVLLGTVEKPQSGIASGVLNSARQVGSVIGVALFGSLISQKARFLAGLHTALTISAVSAFTGAGLSLLIQSKPERWAKTQTDRAVEESRAA